MTKSTKHRTVLLRTLLCGILLLPLLAGCGEGEQEGPVIPIDNALLGVPYDSISYPLDKYELTDEQWRTANYARSILLRRCLLRFGFDVPLPAEIFVKPEVLIDDRHGLASEEHARQWGYRQRPPKSKAVPYELKVPPAAMPILQGEGTTDKSVPAGGCFGESTRVLSEGASEAEGMSRDMDREVMAKAAKDPRVKEKTEEWRSCVKASTGEEYATPHDALRSWNTKTGAHGPPQADEVTAALADVACTRSTGLANLWAAVEVAYQNEAIEQNAQHFEAIRSFQEAWIRNASKVTSQSK